MIRRIPGRWGVFALALGVAVLLGGHFWSPSPWQRTEAYLIDTYQRMRLDPSDEPRVVVVDIDESSIAALGPWPWPRARLADLVARLLDAGEASVIGLDLVLPEPADAEGDRRLAALAADRPVVLAQVFDLAGRVPPLAQGTPIGPLAVPSAGPPQTSTMASAHAGSVDAAPWPEAHGYLANHAGFRGARCAGHINYRPDSDGQVRHVPPFIRWQGADHPSFAIALLRCAGVLEASVHLERAPAGGDRVRLSGFTLPLSPSGDWRIPWTRSLSAYAVVPAADVLGGRASPDLFRGALVLVGSSSLGLSDVVGTPIAASLPGVMVHAQSLSWMLDSLGTPVAPALLGWLPWIWLAVSLAALARYSGAASAAAALGALAAVTLGWIAVAHFAFGAARAELAMPPLLAYAVLFLVGAPVEWYSNQRMSRRLYLAFRDYLPPAVLDRLVQQDAGSAFAVTRRDITILFADIENSTAMAERLEPEALAEFTRGVLEAITRAIHATGGTLDKYLGDGALAFWGAPLAADDHADLALEAAEGIRSEIDRLNAARARAGQPPVVVHLGINTGAVVVGDLGTRFRRTYTAMGEAVNVAHRLQEMAGERGVFAIVGQGTVARLRRAGAELVPVGEVLLRGLTQPQPVHAMPAAAATVRGAGA